MQIDKNEYYSISKIVELNFLPVFGRNRQTILKRILKDKTFNVIIFKGKTKNGCRYKVKGEDIVKYLTKIK